MDSITNCLFYTSLLVYLYLLSNKTISLDVLDESYYFIFFILGASLNFLDLNNSRSKLLMGVSMWAVILSTWENENYTYTSEPFHERFDKISYVITDTDKFETMLHERPLWIAGVFGIIMSVFFNSIKTPPTKFISKYEEYIKMFYYSVVALSLMFTAALYTISDPQVLIKNNLYYLMLWTVIIQIAGIIYTFLAGFGDPADGDKYTIIFSLVSINTILYHFLFYIDSYISIMKPNVSIDNMRFAIKTLIYIEYILIIMTLYEDNMDYSDTGSEYSPDNSSSVTTNTSSMESDDGSV